MIRRLRELLPPFEGTKRPRPMRGRQGVALASLAGVLALARAASDRAPWRRAGLRAHLARLDALDDAALRSFLRADGRGFLERLRALCIVPGADPCPRCSARDAAADFDASRRSPACEPLLGSCIASVIEAAVNAFETSRGGTLAPASAAFDLPSSAHIVPESQCVPPAVPRLVSSSDDPPLPCRARPGAPPLLRLVPRRGPPSCGPDSAA